MHEQLLRFPSRSTSRNFEVMRFGWSGRPVVIFPTTLGRYFEAKDMGLIDSIRPLIDAGKAIVYCPDTLNHESWYNRGLHPADKVRTHIAYDRLIRDELVPALQHHHRHARIVVAGCSFGGYTAANFAFKHPDVVGDLICMSGSFDVASFLDGYHDSNVYFNNPVEFLPDARDPNLWRMGIILGTSEWDICRAPTERLSHILAAKQIDHWLDMRGWVSHDWPLWREMFPAYLGRVLG